MKEKEAMGAAKDLPWAKFIAVNDDGRWYAFSTEPYFESGAWHLPRKGGFGAIIGSSWYLGAQDPRVNSAIEVQR